MAQRRRKSGARPRDADGGQDLRVPSNSPVRTFWEQFNDIFRRLIGTRADDDDIDREETERLQRQFEQDERDLSQIVRELEAKLERMFQTTRSSYARATLQERRAQFLAIATQFSSMTINQHKPLYHFIHRTPERLAAARLVVDKAETAATLFEDYARNPETFSQTTAQMAIWELIEALRNLNPQPW